MDKQKRIEEMAKIIDGVLGSSPTLVLQSRVTGDYKYVKNSKIAEKIVNAGYGNLKEFAEKVKAKARPCIDNLNQGYMIVEVEDIDELLKEYME